jgi:hypothetical protein
MTFSKAKYIADYVIEITYTNGTTKYYDFRKWLFEMCQPVYYKYRKQELFKKVKINKEFGYLTWGQGNEEMDFLPEHIKEFEMKRDEDFILGQLINQGMKSENVPLSKVHAKLREISSK